MQERNQRPRSLGSFLIAPIVQEMERDRLLRGTPIAGFFEMRDLPYLNIGIRDIKANGGETRVYVERRIFTQYQTRTQGRDSSNFISLSVPTTNLFIYDLALFYCVFFNINL